MVSSVESPEASSVESEKSQSPLPREETERIIASLDDEKQQQGKRPSNEFEPIRTNEEEGYNVPDSDQAVDPEREFEVKWDGDNDPMNPRSKSKLHKWIIVLIVSSSSLCVTCASAMYTSTYAQIEPEFGSSREVATLGLSLFVMGLGCGPMVLSPLSEFYGRRPIYIYSYLMFLIWLIPCAVAPNIQTMLIARFFDGLAVLSSGG
ncbi:hypothetical protein B0A49_08178 [Cryomyces minteri]|uniref:Major facilitator superfamily (MFS) profile domain-containing protein n=1 Tax=Cryomyces minteri TaxID=331657 RepID=A0A4U0WG79_9PEZI|nr:hypothetical protein B0A49_08178 [Cryomyces minteri]